LPALPLWISAIRGKMNLPEAAPMLSLVEELGKGELSDGGKIGLLSANLRLARFRFNAL
jgi:hypothetical protein